MLKKIVSSIGVYALWMVYYLFYVVIDERIDNHFVLALNKIIGLYVVPILVICGVVNICRKSKLNKEDIRCVIVLDVVMFAFIMLQLFPMYF